jgi:hypothetical protein
MTIQGNVKFWITTKHLGSKHHMFTCSLTSNALFYASIKIIGKNTFTSPEFSLNDIDTPSIFKIDSDLP